MNEVNIETGIVTITDQETLGHLRWVARAIDKKDTRAFYHGVHVNALQVMIATDGHRLHQAPAGWIPEGSYLIKTLRKTKAILEPYKVTVPKVAWTLATIPTKVATVEINYVPSNCSSDGKEEILVQMQMDLFRLIRDICQVTPSSLFEYGFQPRFLDEATNVGVTWMVLDISDKMGRLFIENGARSATVMPCRIEK